MGARNLLVLRRERHAADLGNRRGVARIVTRREKERKYRRGGEDRFFFHDSVSIKH